MLTIRKNGQVDSASGAFLDSKACYHGGLLTVWIADPPEPILLKLANEVESCTHLHTEEEVP